MVGPSKEPDGLPADHAKMRRSKLAATEAAKAADRERQISCHSAINQNSLSLDRQRPFEEFRNLRIAPRSMETAAALSDSAALAGGVPRSTGSFGVTHPKPTHWVAKNFNNKKMHSTEERSTNVHKLLKAKKEMMNLRTSISNFGGCITRPHSAEPSRRETDKKHATCLEQPSHAQIWTPPTHKSWYPKERASKPYKPIKKNVFGQLLAGREAKEERALEIIDLAEETELPQTQIKLLYKAFERAAQGKNFFNANDFELIMRRMGIKQQSVGERIFKCFSKRRPGVSVFQAIVPFRVAVNALCMLGVGSRAKQAEAIFRVCDEDKSRSLERSELLKFVTEHRPVPEGDNDPNSRQVIRAKKDSFRKVGALFEAVGMTGREELDCPEFVSRVVGSDGAFRAFEAVNPYRYYFPKWDGRDYTLQNVLNCLFSSSDVKERRSIIKDRVEALSVLIDDDASGTLDIEEFTAVLLALGFTKKEANAEAAESCGQAGIPINKFVEHLTEIAGANLTDFVRLEAAYAPQALKRANSALHRAKSFRKKK